MNKKTLNYITIKFIVTHKCSLFFFVGRVCVPHIDEPQQLGLGRVYLQAEHALCFFFEETTKALYHQVYQIYLHTLATIVLAIDSLKNWIFKKTDILFIFLRIENRHSNLGLLRENVRQ
jgi:hypothetical protein